MNADGYICILATPGKQVCPNFTGAISSFAFCCSNLYKYLFTKQIKGYLVLNKESNSYFTFTGKSQWLPKVIVFPLGNYPVLSFINTCQILQIEKVEIKKKKKFHAKCCSLSDTSLPYKNNKLYV